MYTLWQKSVSIDASIVEYYDKYLMNVKYVSYIWLLITVLREVVYLFYIS